VQPLLSLHESVLFVKTQPVAVLQVSVVQTLLSLQTRVVWLHAPVAVSHASIVQALLSLQRTAASQHSSTVPLLILKLGEKPTTGPSTMRPPLKPSKSQTYDIQPQT
jgi:hypothetical protein